jgi:hypothetical protein
VVAVKAFICVYRHLVPSREELQQTRLVARQDPKLQTFLDLYDNPDCFYDWGDDPGFFAASEIFGSPAHASWGVCRPDVRRQLGAGDFIIFFCARQNRESRGTWDYFLVACATVLDSVSREDLWTSDGYKGYRRFYNVLAEWKDGLYLHREAFWRHHDDWERRLESGYIIFDPDPRVTCVDMSTPLRVARRYPSESLEQWFSDDKRVADLEELLFNNLGITRRLRSTNPRIPHRHISLHNAPSINRAGCDVILREMRRNVLAKMRWRAT